MDKKEKLDLEQGLREVFLLKRRVRENRKIAEDLLMDYYREKKKRKTRILCISCAAAILLLAFWAFNPLITGVDSQKLYENAYSRFNPDVYTRDNEGKADIMKGIIAYKGGNSMEAVEIFNNIKTENSENQVFIFYQSLALIDIGQHEDAKNGLELLVEQGNFMLSEVYWYLSLIALHQEDYDTLHGYFKAIKQTDPKAHRQDMRKIMRRFRFR